MYEPPIYSGTDVRASQVSADNRNGGNHSDVLVHVFDLAGAVLSHFLLGSTVHAQKVVIYGVQTLFRSVHQLLRQRAET